MFESLFRFLFKYPPLVFQQGDLAWGASRPLFLAILIAAGVAAAALLTYKTTGGEQPLRDRLILIGLRIGVLALLVICLFRPTLILKASVPQQNFVAVLVDDSRSMTIADTNGQPRSAFVQEQLSGANANLFKALSDRFVLRFFSFASSVDRQPSVANLKYAGTATRLGPALERARDELSGLPLAGLVMVTDGADTSDASLDEPLGSLKARSIPVFTVGLGQEHFSKDIQVTRVETPRAVLKGTSLVVDVMLSQTGYSGQSVTLNVEDTGHIAASQNVTLP
ncbi:MAG TPA: vWA domain-containing protein, partial [Vicinamibacterales bacterium]